MADGEGSATVGQQPPPELGEIRRTRILEAAQQDGSVRVSSLSARFGVTPETIRREINRLVRQGRLTRVHGGAVLPPGAHIHEVPFFSRVQRQHDEKVAIAMAAAQLVEEGDVIALDASTSALELGLALRQRGLRSLVVLTNAVQLPLRLAEADGMTVVSTGGTLRARSLSYVGPQTLRAIEGYRVRKVFLSCKGFTLQDGPTEANEEEAEVKQALLRSSEEAILLADHSKWGHNSLVPICPPGAIQRVVTDRPVAPEVADTVAAYGIRLVVSGSGADGPPSGPQGG